MSRLRGGAARLDVRFSITVRQDTRIRAAIEAIEAIAEDAWTPTPYWLSTPEVSGADVAETSHTAFQGDKRHARTVRLIVRRIRPTPGSQLTRFTDYAYHAFVTDRAGPTLDLEADHRRAQPAPGHRRDPAPHPSHPAALLSASSPPRQPGPRRGRQAAALPRPHHLRPRPPTRAARSRPLSRSIGGSGSVRETV